MTEQGESEALEKIIKEVKRLDQDDCAYLDMLREPAFTKDNDIDRQKQEIEDFLYNIFDQPIEQAYRRNRFYWGERYERKQRIGNAFYWQCKKLIPIRDSIRKIFRRGI